MVLKNLSILLFYIKVLLPVGLARDLLHQTVSKAFARFGCLMGVDRPELNPLPRNHCVLCKKMG